MICNAGETEDKIIGWYPYEPCKEGDRGINVLPYEIKLENGHKIFKPDADQIESWLCEMKSKI